MKYGCSREILHLEIGHFAMAKQCQLWRIKHFIVFSELPMVAMAAQRFAYQIYGAEFLWGSGMGQACLGILKDSVGDRRPLPYPLKKSRQVKIPR